MPTRLITASWPSIRRRSAAGSCTSASTTSTVGSRIRPLARSRRRLGTRTLMLRAQSSAARWVPTKPEPPISRTFSMGSMGGASGQVGHRRVAHGAAWGDHAEAALQRLRLVLEQRRVIDAVAHDLLDVVAG